MATYLQNVPRTVKWGVPAVAGVALAAGVAVIPVVAGANPSLPARSPAQLLASLSRAHEAAFSGTIVQTSRLGLPSVPGLDKLTSAAGQDGSSAASLVSLLTGSHTAKVWYASPTRARVSVTLGAAESDVIRNGRNVWTWDGSSKRGTHATLPADTDKAIASASPSTVTPQELADQALAAVSSTTEVTVDGTARVARRPAYELVLRPKQAGSTIREVRLALDSKTSVPLRVAVYATDGGSPAFQTVFQTITFGTPDAAAFRFSTPAGGKLDEVGSPAPAPTARHGVPPTKAQPGEPLPATGTGQAPFRVLSDGWTTVLALPKGSVPAMSGAAKSSGSSGSKSSGSSASPLGGALNGLTLGTPVSGSYGSGRVVSTTLFSVLVLDDGRAYAGAVTPAVLEHAAS